MKFFSFFKNFRHQLTTAGKKQPIHFFSLFVILALDIFVLTNIFQGLDFQKRQLTSPNESIPYTCEQFIPDFEAKTPTERRNASLEVVKQAIKNNRSRRIINKYSAELVAKHNQSKLAAGCLQILNKAKELNQSKVLRQYLAVVKDLEQSVYEEERALDKLNKLYDTALLERIANQSEEDLVTDLPAHEAKNRIQTHKKLIRNLQSQINAQETRILNEAAVKEFLALTKTQKPRLEQTRSNLEFWYPIKVFGVQMLFLLPLFLFFLWQYIRMQNKENSLLSLIFSHLFLVTLIPMLWKVFSVLADILPFHFLADLLAILEALNLVALWNYFVIALAIGFAFGLIYFLQKKVFSAEAIWQKRLAKQQCWNCGKRKFSKTEKHCSFCGELQQETCKKCGKEKRVKASFCHNCGQ
ncbi:hypothetical protein CSB37_03780 [bacterium DOLZORAL124_38_8]|nr:MAG: hypothetical protein CSB37_03780 [bacterium DOLZORAL124_38_8]